MAKCSCGAELLPTSLTCPSCGKRMTLDAIQTGDTEAAKRVDWDRDFERLAAGDLPPARVEVVPVRRGWWRRLFGRG